MEQRLDLYSERDSKGGTRSVWLRLTNGRLILEGQDLGGAVGDFYDGASEYEWAWTLAPEQVDDLLVRLGVAAGAPDFRAQIGRQLNALPRAEVQAYFRDAGAAFWSRRGD